jgi:hypothetical protein
LEAFSPSCHPLLFSALPDIPEFVLKLDHLVLGILYLIDSAILFQKFLTITQPSLIFGIRERLSRAKTSAFPKRENTNDTT